MKLENNIRNASLVYSQQEKIEKKTALKDEKTEKVDKKQMKEDKLELSVEAFKLQPIKAKIAQGFYDNPDVLNTVAQRLYSEIFPDEVN